MGYLLDTHAIIWHIEDSSKITKKAKEIIDNNKNKIFISSVSLWEIAIKLNLGKLTVNFTFNELLDDIKSGEFTILQIENEYLKGLSSLPFLHKDPFDRLLLATAIAEKLTIITIDENIQKYDVSWVW
ncbi:MAG: type II toxin-antitoxin system VapC family toxin [Oscillospiraceae bacterium]|nr:type II toxin-antitoxin system VapC family toxin [Oscillospiraceae bacterium]